MGSAQQCHVLINDGHKICSEALNQGMKDEIENESRRMISIHWLAGLVLSEPGYKPPVRFWPASRYSAIERLATVTKIRLLTGHSCIATSILRRHIDRTERCTLCGNGLETLEHFLFECQELEQEREEAQKQYGIELIRTKSATRVILEANRLETRVIHQIYSVRVQKELINHKS